MWSLVISSPGDFFFSQVTDFTYLFSARLHEKFVYPVLPLENEIISSSFFFPWSFKLDTLKENSLKNVEELNKSKELLTVENQKMEEFRKEM